MTEDNYTFLLIGKTGNGKSSVGNSILGFEAFQIGDSSESVTTVMSLRSKSRSGYYITVLDTPGIMDTNVDIHRAKSKACEDMKKAMAQCTTNGKLALIIVLKYGERYTSDNKFSLVILKHIFGEEKLCKSCVIVMTHGDLYNGTYKGTKCFDDWMSEQTGLLGDFLKLCGNKCVLFCNGSDNKELGEKQFENLMKMVKTLDQGYTLIQFENAKKERGRLMLEAELPTLKEHYDKEIDRMQSVLKTINEGPQAIQALNKLDITTTQLLNHVNDKDSPHVIFYTDGECRFLEKERASLNRLKGLIEEKRNYVMQSQTTREICSEINALIKSIQEINVYDQNIYVYLSEYKERIKSLHTTAMQEDLKDELKNKIKLRLNKCNERLKEQMEKAEREREFEINREKDEIISKIKSSDVQNKSISQILSQIKDRIGKLELKLITGPSKYRIEFREMICKCITDMREEIYSKEETVRQLAIADELYKKIKSIQERIKEVNANEFSIREMVSSIREHIARLDLTDMYGTCRTEVASAVNNTTKKLLKLEKRVILFLALEMDIQALTDKYNDLGIPCQIYHFKELNEECEKLQTNVNTSVSNSDDRVVLTKRLDVIKNAIADKKKENDKRIAAICVTPVPVAGVITAVGLAIALSDPLIVRHDKEKELDDAKNSKLQ